MEGYTKGLTKKTTIVISTVLIIAIVLISTNVQALAIASSATPNECPWTQRAVEALKRARGAIGHAMDKIVEQAEQGADVSLAKDILKASIRIYGTAERAFGEGHYRKAFFAAVLSGLVARDSMRIAVEGPEAVDAIVDEVEEKLKEMKKLVEELENSGEDIGCLPRVLGYAERLHTKAHELVNEKPVRALVAVEIGRILVYVAEKMAQRSQ